MVLSIAPNLTAGVDLTKAVRQKTFADFHIEGVKKGAQFEVDDKDAQQMLLGINPHGRPNSDVILPYFNGEDLIRGRSPGWIIYYPPHFNIEQASLYEVPFRKVKDVVYPKYGTTRKKWWIHERPRPELSKMLAKLGRYFATVKHSKHRLFVWLPTEVLVSNAIELFACSADYFFGVLHSRQHEIWALRLGTRLETRPRYTPTTCFETFPFPALPETQQEAIAQAAKELDTLRDHWLNPPEWTKQEILEFPGSVAGPWARYIHDADLHGIGTVRYPRLIPKDDGTAAELKKRTLTNLYNQRPTWLDLAHKKLDAAVFAAYGWDAKMTDDEILAALLALNLERAKQEQEPVS